jgi:ACS family hexuronate transporter-like MFS transporter
LDRQILAVLSPTILSDTHLSVQAYTEVISGFSLAYMIGNPLWGALMDRIGARSGLTLAVAIWTAASVSHAFAAGFLGFMAARILLGAGEAATFPGVLRTVLDTLPPRDQGKGIALGYAGISAASVVAPFVFIPMASHWGWRAAFLTTGVFGLIWTLTWRWTVPAARLSVGVSTATSPSIFERPFWDRTFARPSWEKTVLRRVSLRTFGRNPLARVIRRLPKTFGRRFWVVFTTYAMGALPLAPVLYLSPLYLRSIGYSQSQLTHVLWIPPVGWEAGSFFWAWVMDNFSRSPSRPRIILALLAILSLPLATITLFKSDIVVIGLLFGAMFIAGGFLVIALRSSVLWFPEGNSSSVAGIGAGSWSLIVALMLPFLGRRFDHHQYGLSFLSVAVVPVLGTLGWFVLTSRQPHVTVK